VQILRDHGQAAGAACIRGNLTPECNAAVQAVPEQGSSARITR
jgi:hypothetical protein